MVSTNLGAERMPRRPYADQGHEVKSAVSRSGRCRHALGLSACRLAQANKLSTSPRVPPGRELHSLEIVGCAGGCRPAGEMETVLLDDGGAQTNGFGDSGEHLDDEAKAAYKRRLVELRQEVEEARAGHDAGRCDRLQEEIDFLTQEMARALGLRGRNRRAGSAVERARVNVTRTISLALGRIRAQHPALGDHFARTIRTGTFCTYAPDLRVPIEWKV